MSFRSIAIKAADRLPEGMATRLRSNSAAARLVRPLANRILPAEESVVTVRSGAGKGLKLPIDPQLEKYYWTGNHEPHVQRVLERELKPGMCVWDIGAHIGFFATIAGRLVGDSGTVVAFEPMPETRDRLRRSADLNGLSNITIEAFAVADTSGHRMLYPPATDSGTDQAFGDEDFTTMWSLVDPPPETDGIEVECRRIDELSATLPWPDLIKIDAERAESEVVAGGIELLSQRKTKVLIEISDAATLDRVRGLLPDFEFENFGSNHWLLN